MKSLLLMSLLTGCLVGCQPSYPQCADDRDCRADGYNEYCLNGLCAQCRDDNHCAVQFDERYVCESGACIEIAGYCRAGVFRCPDGMLCRDQRCGPECLTDAECPGWPERCKDGRCVPMCGCIADRDCPPGSICHDCACVYPPQPVAMGRAIRFPVGWAEPDADGEALVAETAEVFFEYRRTRAAGFIEVGCRAPSSGHPDPDALARMRVDVIRHVLGELKLPPEYVVRVPAKEVFRHETFEQDGDDNWCGVNFVWSQPRPVDFEPGESALSADAEAGLRRTASYHASYLPVLGVACAAPDASPALNAARLATVVEVLLDAGVPEHGIVVAEQATETRYDCALDWLHREMP